MRLQITIVSSNEDDILRMKDVLRKPYANAIMQCVAKASEHTTITVRESVQRPKTDVGPVISKPMPSDADLDWECDRCKHVNPINTIHCFNCGRAKNPIKKA